ncbi:MAG: hypothetical protein U0934_17275 [Pseudotabrizicola sp.]|uniref:hypothetical protein n=1 Tax=Pseudotabrizicola sp. TaxID=2939647 RepID=UPI002730B7D4|nr:hypothetical protein [Pseudotabrizicola sp.]MDP2079938.1 hypothetical protein [Pseudotabrizicola sp.]MDZ7575677.1 hypothetical protein [Pseudotabrizicola sp.]
MTAPILSEGETLVATFTPDRLTYWRAHLIMAIALGAAVGLVLLWQGNPYPVMGPIGAALAIAVRALYVASEALGDLWTLTDRRLIGPRGLTLPRAQITTARPFFGSVQVITATGDKHLIKYLADPAADAARLTQALR